MSFDPNYPQGGAPMDPAAMRGQLNGLNDKIPASAEIANIATLNPGEPATAGLVLDGAALKLSLGIPRGADGVSITAVIVDSVTTLNPGESAYMTATLTGSTLHLALGIPRGSEGGAGPPGAQGPPFAGVVVDSVATLDPGVSAYVNATFDGTNVHLAIGLPRGNDGGQGAQGAQGVPGEVTLVQLGAAIDGVISGSSANTNSVPTLDTPMADPDAEAIRLKLNDLILALRRV